MSEPGLLEGLCATAGEAEAMIGRVRSKLRVEISVGCASARVASRRGRQRLFRFDLHGGGTTMVGKVCAPGGS